jgi:hypothetical protein
MDAAMLAPLAGMADNAVGLADNAVGLADNVAVAVSDVAHTNPFSLTGRALDDIGTAGKRVDEAIERIQALIAQHGDGPFDEAMLASTKDARVGVKNVSLEAQARIEPYIAEGAGTEPAVFSKLKQADANLEDSNWQLAKNPSPDGRFNGLDLQGSLGDAVRAQTLLRELVPLPAAVA